jgi:uncharacterized protein (TIGR03663 family)
MSIATVAFLYNFRRYLGKAGTIAAMIMMTISPYMLYYGRYVRNEAWVALFGLLSLWALLRYLETGANKYSYWLTAAVILHFTAKETAFIYTAQLLIFLAIYFINQVFSRKWRQTKFRDLFLIMLVLGFFLLTSVGITLLIERSAGEISATETVTPAVPGAPLETGFIHASSPIVLILLGLSLVVFILAGIFLVAGFGWQEIRKNRAFSLLMIIGTLVLPMLAAFPMRLLGFDIPTNATDVQSFVSSGDIWRVGFFLAPLMIMSVILGLLWNPRQWLINAGIWYSIFVIFYTTLFTNGAGFFTGLVGSLGYWLEQQSVNRGSQPWYYYLFVQIPVYEYLPALASIFSILLLVYRGIKNFLNRVPDGSEPTDINLPSNEPTSQSPVGKVDLESQDYQKPPVFFLLIFWIITSFIAYSVAGEKMPWLSVHITWPMILLGGWGIGQLIEMVDWKQFRQPRLWLVIILIPIFLLSLSAALGSLFGSEPPFQGSQLVQLQATSTFLLSIIIILASGIGLFYLLAGWRGKQILVLFLLFIFGGLGVLSARAAFQSSYLTYDQATELLVYAHSAPGVKQVMQQIEEISRRTSDGLALPVAHDGEYPFWWYLRNYTNTNFYGANPSRSLREYPVIIVGETNFNRIEPVVATGYERYDYIRLWWPNQDYFGLTLDRFSSMIKDPAMREALFDIWLNRDYSKYGEVTGVDMSLPNWSPNNKMRMYVRRDIIAQLWNYGSLPAAEEIIIDPYEGKQIELFADALIGSPGVEPGQFQRPRDLAVAEDGSLYVVDTDNHRIQHLSPDGVVLHMWGSFSDITQGSAPGGMFNQPWGIGLGTDGSVYIADTWNHRIQKFTPDGQFIKMWGFFGQAESADAFWGPRDVAVDENGRVFVTDTGNKRVVIFDEEGTYLGSFGTPGMAPGQLDEPVGISVDPLGFVYIADTWNQRVQVFEEQDIGGFVPAREWEIAGWYGTSTDNKPYLSVDGERVFVADPEGYRILQFTSTGEIINFWGDFSAGNNGFGLAASVAIDPRGGVWVSDAGNSRLMHFNPPGE